MKIIDSDKISNVVSYFNNLFLNELKNNDIVCWVAGGCIRDYLIGAEVNDFDLCFPNENEFNKADRYFSLNKGICLRETHNVKRYKLSRLTKKPFDLSKRYSYNPEDTINKYDFTVCMFATDGNKFFSGPTSLVDLENKSLILHNPHQDTRSTVARMREFTWKGYSISLEEHDKIIELDRRVREIKYDTLPRYPHSYE